MRLLARQATDVQICPVAIRKLSFPKPGADGYEVNNG